MTHHTSIIPSLTVSEWPGVAKNQTDGLPWNDEAWQQCIQGGFSQPAELLAWLGLAESELVAEVDAEQAFTMKLPRGFAEKMKRGDAADPLLRQVLPIRLENEPVPAFVNDPLQEAGVMPNQGVVYKYQSRVLVVVTGACAIHCRYCFRRHFPYAEHTVSSAHWSQLRDFLAQHSEVNEVILSGGDPLSVSTRRLMPLIDVIQDFPQIRRLRLHTRLPVVVPERINHALLEFIEQIPVPVVVVLHVNHSQELGAELALAVSALRARGAWVLNQSVLLKGVNDDLDVLLQLSEQLFSIGIMPYYLHLLDPVAGAAHFSVPSHQAQLLYGELLTNLPGFLVPRLVREEPGQPSKTWLSPCYT